MTDNDHTLRQPFFGRSKYSRGFTLFETIIYIALFGVLMSGCVISTFQIFEGIQNTELKTHQESELNFILHKIDYLVANGKITDQLKNSTSSELFITTNDLPYHMRAMEGVVYLNDVPITSRTADVGSMIFEYIDINDHDTIRPLLRYQFTLDTEHVGPINIYTQ